jgi:hypothetical protein
MPFLLEMVSQLSLETTLSQPSQLAARPGMVFVGLLPDADVLVEVLRVVGGVVEVGLGVDVGLGVEGGLAVVLGAFVDDGVGSLVTSPMTQYDRSVFRPGHVMLGFSIFKSLTDNPQLLAKSSQVAPRLAVVSKEQSTPRAVMKEDAATTAAGTPATNRSDSCIFFSYASELERKEKLDQTEVTWKR